MTSPRDQIRDAIERLLYGTPQYTDGRLTRTNLALEAGVGRATLYRQPDLLDEWARRTAGSAGQLASTSLHAVIARLTQELDQERQRRHQCERICESLALVVADLYRQLEARHDSSMGGSPILPINPKQRSPRTTSGGRRRGSGAVPPNGGHLG